LLTNDEKLAARARSLRVHAQSARYIHEEVGCNYRMDSLQAAVLRVKLKRLDAWNAARASHARRYGEQLAGTPHRLPSVPGDSESVWHRYVIECANRDRVRAALTDAGIDTAINYPMPLYPQPAYRPLGYCRGDLPVAEQLCERYLHLRHHGRPEILIVAGLSTAFPPPWPAEGLPFARGCRPVLCPGPKTDKLLPRKGFPRIQHVP